MRTFTTLCLLLVFLPNASVASTGMWLTHAEIKSLRTNNGYWQRVKQYAAKSVDGLVLHDQDENKDIYLLAKALVWARTGSPVYRQQVTDQIRKTIGAEPQGRVLALARNLLPVVIAADIVGLSADDDTRFKAWLRKARDTVLAPGWSLVTCHEQRPNNWGTMAGAARIAVDVYVSDREDLAKAAAVFEGFCGNRARWKNFKFGHSAWSANPARPQGINPSGATIQGRNVDGCIPDDARRWQNHRDRSSGPFRYPWPTSDYALNYSWETLQGVIVQTVLLTRQGYSARQWQDEAPLRAYRWLLVERKATPDRDDRWGVVLVDYLYGTRYWDGKVTSHGKLMGMTCWTHGHRRHDAFVTQAAYPGRR